MYVSFVGERSNFAWEPTALTTMSILIENLEDRWFSRVIKQICVQSTTLRMSEDISKLHSLTFN